jgi:hypothetical protein
MSTMSRRTFIKVSSGALSACARGPAGAAESTVQPGPEGDATKIFTVFFGFAPSRDDTDLEPVSNQEIVRRLHMACDGVEFVVRDLTRGVGLPSVLQELKELPAQACDGVLIFGSPRHYDLLRSGLPTINVSVVNDFMNVPFPLFKKHRVVHAFLDPWKFSADPEVAERMFSDLAEKIKLIRAIKRMKQEHILTVTDSPFVNVIYGDMRRNPPPDYNERILGAIDETFGTRVTKIGTRDVVEDPEIAELWAKDSREATEIGRRWIQNARKMINTIESEVVRSAKVYLAMKRLMERHEATATAFHIRTLTPRPQPEDYVCPALATSEFQLEGTVGKCQSHLNILLSEMLLQYAYQRPSMLGDFAIDTYNNTSMVQHCEGPWNPWGDERRVPYILTDHRERRVRGRSQPGVGAASCILYPAGQPVTMWQIDVLSKDVLVHTGETVPMFDGPVRYRDHFYEMM